MKLLPDARVQIEDASLEQHRSRYPSVSYAGFIAFEFTAKSESLDTVRFKLVFESVAAYPQQLGG